MLPSGEGVAYQPTYQRAWLLSKGDLNPIKEQHGKQTMTLCSLGKHRRSFAEQDPVVLQGMLLTFQENQGFVLAGNLHLLSV